MRIEGYIGGVICYLPVDSLNRLSQVSSSCAQQISKEALCRAWMRSGRQIRWMRNVMLMANRIHESCLEFIGGYGYGKLLRRSATVLEPCELVPHWQSRICRHIREGQELGYSAIESAAKISFAIASVFHRIDPATFDDLARRIRVLWESAQIALHGTPVERYPQSIVNQQLLSGLPRHDPLMRPIRDAEAIIQRDQLLATPSRQVNRTDAWRWIAQLRGVDYQRQSEAEAMLELARWDDATEAVSKSDIKNVIRHCALLYESRALVHLLDDWKDGDKEQIDQWLATPPSQSSRGQQDAVYPFFSIWPAEELDQHQDHPHFLSDLRRLLYFMQANTGLLFFKENFTQGECPSIFHAAKGRSGPMGGFQIRQSELALWWQRVCDQYAPGEQRVQAARRFHHLASLGTGFQQRPLITQLVLLAMDSQTPARADLICLLSQLGNQLRLNKDLTFTRLPEQVTIDKDDYHHLTVAMLLSLIDNPDGVDRNLHWVYRCVLTGLEESMLPPEQVLHHLKRVFTFNVTWGELDHSAMILAQEMLKVSAGQQLRQWDILPQLRERVKCKDVWKEAIITLLSASLLGEKLRSHTYINYDSYDADLAFMYRDILNREDIEAIASFIVEGRPIEDRSRWEKFTTKKHSLDAFPGPRARGIVWKLVPDQHLRCELASEMWTDPDGFHRLFGAHFRAFEFRFEHAGPTAQNFSLVPNLLMRSHDCSKVADRCLEPELADRLSSLPDAVAGFKPEEGSWPEMKSPKAFGRTLVGERCAVKVQRKGESDEEFVREFFFMNEVAPLLKSEFPSPKALYRVSQGVPEPLAEMIRRAGIEVSDHPLILVSEVTSDEYWIYPDQLTDEDWEQTVEEWIEDEMRLLMGGFVHDTGLPMEHGFANTQLRGLLFTSPPGRFTRGRMGRVLHFPHPNVGKGGLRDPDGYLLDHGVEDPSLISTDLSRFWVRSSRQQKRAYLIANKIASLHWSATAIEMRRRMRKEEFDYQDSEQVQTLAVFGQRVASLAFAHYLKQPMEKAQKWWEHAGVDWEQYARELLYWLHPPSYVPDVIERNRINPKMMPEGMRTSVDLEFVSHSRDIGFCTDGQLDISGPNCPNPLFQNTLIWDLCAMAPVFATADL